MAEIITPLEIPGDILTQIYGEARLSFPAECCGWLSGPAEGTSATTLRRCDNAQEAGGVGAIEGRTAERAYVIDGNDLLELNRSLDSDTPALIIYHSHPNGGAYFSPTDREVATSPWGDGPAYPVQQLVVGITDERVVEAALFAWSDNESGFIEIAKFQGAEI